MLRLRMLGGLSIDHEAGQRDRAASLAPADAPPAPLTGAAVQRRPLALLAFLATAGDGGRSRDDVLLHLWPDSTPVRARHVLKQTLYALRRDLHAPDLVLAHGDRLRLNPAVVTSDVAELEEALDRGELARARALLGRGPFLDGFSLGDVPEFEGWARGERARVAARVEAAAARGADPRGDARAPPAHAPRGRPGTRRLVAGGIAALVALTTLGPRQAGRGAHDAAPAAPRVDAALVAVLPFDAAGADPALGFLARGMVDLLAIRLAGDRSGGLRTVAPRVALGAWERAPSAGRRASTPTAALQAAERLGAGRVLRGSVVGTPARLVLTADVRAVPGGAALGLASVAGSADSLPALLDRLAAMLLLGADAADGGAEPAARAALAATPLAAIRDYVEGQAAYHGGRYHDALRHFARALARDSTFALAALGLAQSAGWAGAPERTIQRGVRLAWSRRDRLPRRARLVLEATAGGADALASGYAPSAALIDAAEQAAEANPDDPEMWYWLGDRYLHLGPAIGLAAPLERASAAFRRAVALDPAFAPPSVHLVQLAARAGDTAGVRRFGGPLLARDSTSESAQFVRWRMALAFGDSAALARLRPRLDETPIGTLRLIVATAECDAVGFGDADRAVETMLRRSATADERAIALVHAHAYALDRGRRAEALRATEALGDADPVPRLHLRIRVLDALYAGGDTAAARAAADTLRAFADAPRAGDARARSAQYEDIAVVTQWQLWHGDHRTLARALERLTAAAPPSDPPRRVAANRIAAALLRAIAANTGGSRDPAAVDALDSLLAANVLAPLEWPGLYPALVAARLFAAGSRPDRALAAVRRRVAYHPESGYLAPSLALEARLAAQLGDTVGAGAVRRALRALRAPRRADSLAHRLAY